MAIEIAHEKRGEVDVLWLKGTLDSTTTPDLRKRMNAIKTPGKEAPRVVVDMARLDLISSVGWGVFVDYARDFKERNGAIAFVSMNDRVDRLYSLMGVRLWIEHYRDLDEALAKYCGQRPEKY